jgi:hypothetical protein
MIKRFLRVSLASLALVLAISGAMNLNRVGAEVIIDDGNGGGGGSQGLCQTCGCNLGTLQCCSQGTIICYSHAT